MAQCRDTVSRSFLMQFGMFIESFSQMRFEGKWLQNRLRADKDESKSLLAVDFQGHQRRGFCIVPIQFGITQMKEVLILVTKKGSRTFSLSKKFSSNPESGIFYNISNAVENYNQIEQKGSPCKRYTTLTVG